MVSTVVVKCPYLLDSDGASVCIFTAILQSIYGALQVFGRPLGKAYRSAIVMVFLSVCASVTRMHYGETPEPIEFIFGSYLPLDKSNPHLKGVPVLPLRGVMGPKILVSLGKNRPTLSIRDQICHKRVL